MFEKIYNRSYRRNKELVNGLGLTYSKKQHALYMHKVQAQELAPLSIKGAIIVSKLDHPINAESARHWFEYVNDEKGWDYTVDEVGKEKCRQETIEDTQNYMNEKKPVLQKYVKTLSDVLGVELMFDNEIETKDRHAPSMVFHGNENRAMHGYQTFSFAVPALKRQYKIA